MHIIKMIEDSFYSVYVYLWHVYLIGWIIIIIKFM